MAKHDKKVSYDEQGDMFAIHKGFSSDEKFKGNIDAGDLILDMSTMGRVRGIEILNATEMLKEFGVGKEELKRLKAANFNAKVTANSTIVGLELKTSTSKIPAKIAVHLAR